MDNLSVRISVSSCLVVCRLSVCAVCFGWFSTKEFLFRLGESELVGGSLLELWRVVLHCLVECAIIKLDKVSLCFRI